MRQAEKSVEEIRAFWDKQALVGGTAASWTDRWMIELEVSAVAKHLLPGDFVLDVGCATGYSTVEYARRRQVVVRGVDYVPAMIEQAKRRLVESPVAASVEFAVGDVLALQEPHEHYDTVVATRVVINLHDWKSQLLALDNCCRSLRPGGRLLLAESTVQGWEKLNRFRLEWGLEEIPVPSQNLFLDEEHVVRALSGEMELVGIESFASTYSVATRVLKPVLINAAQLGLLEQFGIKIDPSDTGCEWNRWWAEAPNWGDYGAQKLFVFRKHRGRDSA